MKRELVCESCGATLECGVADDACWCGDVLLEPEAHALLAESYGDCLCPVCLKAAGAAVQTESGP